MTASHAGWSGMRLLLVSVTQFDPVQTEQRPAGGTWTLSYFSQKSSEKQFLSSS